MRLDCKLWYTKRDKVTGGITDTATLPKGGDAVSLDLIVKILDVLLKVVGILSSMLSLLGSNKEKKTRKIKKNHRR